MNYELAKELKDAGFPQNGREKWYCAHDIWGPPEYRESCDCTAEKIVTYPTLEELIDACGVPLHLRCDGGFWFAERNKQYKAESKSTPIEAVARLFLALSPKQI